MSPALRSRPDVSCVKCKRYEHVTIILKKYDHVIGDFHVRPLLELPYSIEMNRFEVALQSAYFPRTPALISSAVHR